MTKSTCPLIESKKSVLIRNAILQHFTSSFSNWQQGKSGVPRGSVLGSLLFNLSITDFIYVIEDSEVCNIADDNTIYAFDDSIETILRLLKGDINNALE